MLGVERNVEKTRLFTEDLTCAENVVVLFFFVGGKDLYGKCSGGS